LSAYYIQSAKFYAVWISMLFYKLSSLVTRRQMDDDEEKRNKI